MTTADTARRQARARAPSRFCFAWRLRCRPSQYATWRSCTFRYAESAARTLAISLESSSLNSCDTQGGRVEISDKPTARKRRLSARSGDSDSSKRPRVARSRSKPSSRFTSQQNLIHINALLNSNASLLQRIKSAPDANTAANHMAQFCINFNNAYSLYVEPCSCSRSRCVVSSRLLPRSAESRKSTRCRHCRSSSTRTWPRCTCNRAPHSLAVRSAWRCLLPRYQWQPSSLRRRHRRRRPVPLRCSPRRTSIICSTNRRWRPSRRRPCCCRPKRHSSSHNARHSRLPRSLARTLAHSHTLGSQCLLNEDSSSLLYHCS